MVHIANRGSSSQLSSQGTTIGSYPKPLKLNPHYKLYI